jgi:asparagine synthase (glutamine-hydrolysing)
MCGISGLLDARGTTSTSELEHLATAMSAMLTHRGPDDSGAWADAAGGVGLAFRRLSIIDLTPTGHQPMTSADGRYVLVYNGEIYNYRTLRAELSGTRFRGSSDTEVLLEAIAAWGPRRALERANGMFALACWDKQERWLHLARDRFGEKPLYYGWCGNTFLFGSELKALRAHPAFTTTVDRDALALYFRYSCVPAPRSVYTGIAKLEPGTLLTVDPSRPGEQAVAETYWSAIDVALAGAAIPLTLDRSSAADAVEEALGRSVELRTVADVPVGAFLSGGTDSTLVAALMQAQHTSPVRTFTMGFHAQGYDEAARARAIAQHLGTDHTELYVTPAEAAAVVPKLASIYDEPFADSSQIPTRLVAELARHDVTVALSGDGGDELFGGYTRYFAIDRVRRLAGLPRVARRAAAAALRSQSPQRWDRVARATFGAVPGRHAPAQAGDKIHKLAGALATDERESLYRSLVSCWDEPVVLGGTEPPTVLAPPAEWAVPPLERAMLADTVTYLPDDLLAKVDRATMSVSLEARVPMLDPDLFSLAWQLPRDLKVRNGKGKRVLVDVLHRHVPPALVDGPKTGFGVPFGEWLRGPLREWASDLLSRDRLQAEGYLDVDAVTRCWDEHLDGGRDHRHRLWAVLMFEAWLDG